MNAKQKIRLFIYSILTLCALLTWGYVLVFKNRPPAGQSAEGNPENAFSQTQIWLKDKIINTGHKKLNTAVAAVFELKNTGTVPLVIDNITTDCNCAVPEWIRTPILPNQIFHVKLVYNGRNPGFFQKKGIIKANIPNGVLVIVMRGDMY